MPSFSQLTPPPSVVHLHVHAHIRALMPNILTGPRLKLWVPHFGKSCWQCHVASMWRRRRRSSSPNLAVAGGIQRAPSIWCSQTGIFIRTIINFGADNSYFGPDLLRVLRTQINLFPILDSSAFIR